MFPKGSYSRFPLACLYVYDLENGISQLSYFEQSFIRGSGMDVYTFIEVTDIFLDMSIHRIFSPRYLCRVY